jgi:hypothetical protein
MATILENEAKLKEIFKTAIVEVLEERSDLVSDVLRDVLEDIALARAIEEGEKTPLVSRSEIFEVLEKTN